MRLYAPRVVDLTSDTTSSSSSSCCSSDIEEISVITIEDEPEMKVKNENTVKAEPDTSVCSLEYDSSSIKSEPISISQMIKREEWEEADSEFEDGHKYTYVKSESEATTPEIKDEQDLNLEQINLLKSLLAQHAQQQALPSFPSSKKTSTRKPKLKYRPPNGTVLNINDLDVSQNLEDQLEIGDLSFLHYALTYSKKMVVITGAGISVGSGIPDFRSSNGLFNDLASKGTGSAYLNKEDCKDSIRKTLIVLKYNFHIYKLKSH
ncbi:unnamed protein product [Ambrosiozyma monospora]|uniref:Unnamed protein product n=1 Tax=Ambrosiozyma monospora TaxID=43982 RepID=A0ACB5TJU3_AMBMO|nr:unnamed protein product [Ambrosiozyma monospora]